MRLCAPFSVAQTVFPCVCVQAWVILYMCLFSLLIQRHFLCVFVCRRGEDCVLSRCHSSTLKSPCSISTSWRPRTLYRTTPNTSPTPGNTLHSVCMYVCIHSSITVCLHLALAPHPATHYIVYVYTPLLCCVFPLLKPHTTAAHVVDLYSLCSKTLLWCVFPLL